MKISEAIKIHNELEDNELVQKYMEALHIVVQQTERKPRKEHYKSSNIKDYYIEFPYKYLTFENGKAVWQKCNYNCSYKCIKPSKYSGGNYCLSKCNKTRKDIEEFINREILKDLQRKEQ